MGNVQIESANWAKSGYKTLIRNSEATQKKRWPRSKILHDKQLTSFTLNLNFEACSVACEAIEVMPLYFCIFCSHYFGGHLTVIYAHGNPENNFGSISFVEYLVQHSWFSLLSETLTRKIRPFNRAVCTKSLRLDYIEWKHLQAWACVVNTLVLS